jgi:hypothetical protein
MRRCLMPWIDIEMFDNGLGNICPPSNGAYQSVRSCNPSSHWASFFLGGLDHNSPMIFTSNPTIGLFVWSLNVRFQKIYNLQDDLGI